MERLRCVLANSRAAMPRPASAARPARPARTAAVAFASPARGTLAAPARSHRALHGCVYARQDARVQRCVRACAEAEPPIPAAEQAPLPELLPLDDPKFEAMHSFSPFANWLIPGMLMLGRYPGVEPSGRCATREAAEAQLRQIIEAGIVTFVCLQHELPDQAEMPIRGINGFLPYKSTAMFIASAVHAPPPMKEVSGLRNRNLDKFLPPRRRPKPYVDLRPEVQFARYPIVDLSVPSMDELDAIVNDVERRLRSGEVIYLHCWGGRGRAGTTGACVLAKMYGLTGDEALERVQLAFDTRQDGGRQSPETQEQIELVKAYAAKVNGK